MATNSNTISSNLFSSGLQPVSEPSQSSGGFQQFQGFSSKTIQEDFGDFQQSSSTQFPAMPNTPQSEVLNSHQSSIFGVTSDNQNKHQPIETGNRNLSSDIVQLANTRDLHQSSAVHVSVMPRAQSLDNSQGNPSVNTPPLTTADKAVEKTVKVQESGKNGM